MSQGILVSDHLGYNLWKGKCAPEPVTDTHLPVATLLLEISSLDSPCFNAGQDSTTRLWVGGISLCVVVVAVMVCKLLPVRLWCFAGSRCGDSLEECVQRGINTKVCVAGTRVTSQMRPLQRWQQHQQQRCKQAIFVSVM